VTEERFDFHIHTRASDGTLSPREVGAVAARSGLAGISYTDHDTVAAYPDLPVGMGQASPKVLPGIEVSASIDGTEIHILGYFPGGFPAGLEPMVRTLLEDRARRIREGLRNLVERGVDIGWAELAAEAAGGVMSRGHLAQILVRKGYVKNVCKAFPSLLGPDVIRPPSADGREVVKEVLRLGGIPVWAHPMVDHMGFLDGLREAGLAGFELHTAWRRATETRKLRRKISGSGLLVTGGSDWHGLIEEKLGAWSVGREEVTDFLRTIGW
jgi:3',5'-nucleoside bisphosphate phosphatase